MRGWVDLTCTKDALVKKSLKYFEDACNMYVVSVLLCIGWKNSVNCKIEKSINASSDFVITEKGTLSVLSFAILHY